MRQTGTFELTVAPATEPLSLENAKAHCRADGSAEDAVFTLLIASARRFVGKDCGLALITQTWQALFDAWDKRGLRLRPHPFGAVSEVAVWDGTAFTAQTLADFQVLEGRPAAMIPAHGLTPAVAMRPRQGIRITYTAGFGGSGDAVPADIRTAMLQLVAHWYEQREPTAAALGLSVVGDIKFTVATLLAPWRPIRLV